MDGSRHRTILYARALATALAAALVIAGCSGSRAGDATATAAPAGAASAAPSAPATAEDAPDSGAAPLNGNAYDPCKKLALADVQVFFLAAVTMKPETDLVGPTAGCTFSTADGVSSLQILTVTGPQAEGLYTHNLKEDDVAAVPVAGVGDRAVRDPKDVWVYAMKDGVFCMVHGAHGSTGGTGTGQLKGLRNFDVSSDVPDAIAAAVAAQLGTLCNKIYGSGSTVPNFSGLR
jgi:hypothetical protein